MKTLVEIDCAGQALSPAQEGPILADVMDWHMTIRI